MSRRPSYYLNGESLGALGFLPAPGSSGRRNGLAFETRGLQLPGVAGELDAGAPRQAAVRTIEIVGEVRGTGRADVLDKVETILALSGRGLVELRAVDAADRMILVERTGVTQVDVATPSLAEQDGASKSVSLTLRFRAADPTWRDREPQLLAIGQGSTPLPLGKLLPSPWTLEILGSELGTVVAPQVLYEDAGGNVLRTLTLSATLDWSTDATARYRISTEGVAPRVERMIAGVWTGADAECNGDFFPLSPLDGWIPGGAYPRLRLYDAGGRATGQLRYRRRYEL
ncbi:MAG: hypothetical protein KF709_02605 [Gemmatimonadaceae bacterium]|nr:hypothetical protein [Gemmatimonadaceae bacterium]